MAADNEEKEMPLTRPIRPVLESSQPCLHTISVCGQGFLRYCNESLGICRAMVYSGAWPKDISHQARSKVLVVGINLPLTSIEDREIDPKGTLVGQSGD